jgi:F plasmid transfer operon, TraF, protein
MGRAQRALLVLFLALSPVAASAQVSFDVTGARALGMAGAFVAVADDPTATHWNPAGLVKGSPVGLTIGSDSFHFRKPYDPVTSGAEQLSARMFHLGTWPLGLSAGRIETRQIVGSNATGLLGESLSITQVGVTVLQTILDIDVGSQQLSVVAGGTVKFLRGTARITSIPTDLTTEQAFDLLSDAPGQTDNVIDLDLGFLAAIGRLRGGVTLKNLRQPTFAHVAGNAIPLWRLARMGLSVTPADGVTLAMDVDLDTADPLVGLRRVIALGGEIHPGSRLALRGGIRWSRDGGRPIGAFGGSLRVQQSLLIDGYVAAGSGADQGFGIALRAALK